MTKPEDVSQEAWDRADQWQKWKEVRERAEARVAAMTKEDHEFIFQNNALMQHLAKRSKAKE